MDKTQKIEMTIRTPDLEAVLVKVVEMALAHAIAERGARSASSAAHMDLEAKRIALAERAQDAEDRRVALAEKDHAQRLVEWQAQEARRAKGETIY